MARRRLWTTIHELREPHHPSCKQRRVQVGVGGGSQDDGEDEAGSSRHQVSTPVGGDPDKPTFWRTIPKAGDSAELREATERMNKEAEARAHLSFSRSSRSTGSVRTTEQKQRRNELERLRRAQRAVERRASERAKHERLEEGARAQIKRELAKWERMEHINALNLGVRDFGVTQLKELATRLGSRHAAERLAARARNHADAEACEGMLRYWFASFQLSRRELTNETLEAAGAAFPEYVSTRLIPGDGFFFLDLNEWGRRVWRRFGGRAGLKTIKCVRVGELAAVAPRVDSHLIAMYGPCWFWAMEVKKVWNPNLEQRRALRRLSRLVSELFDGGGTRARDKREELIAQSQAEALFTVTLKMERQLVLIAELAELLPQIFQGEEGDRWRITSDRGVEVRELAKAERPVTPVGMGDFGFGHGKIEIYRGCSGGGDREMVWVAWGCPSTLNPPRVNVDAAVYETQGGLEVARPGVLDLCCRCQDLSGELYRLLNPFVSLPGRTEELTQPVRPVREGDRAGPQPALDAVKKANSKLGGLSTLAFHAAHPETQSRHREDLEFMLSPPPPLSVGMPPPPPATPAPPGTAGAEPAVVAGVGGPASDAVAD